MLCCLVALQNYGTGRLSLQQLNAKLKNYNIKARVDN
jgi:hypothetical protein